VKPIRIQLSRRAGFSLQITSLAINGLPAVNCARPTKWGNPFPAKGDYTAKEATQRFADLLETGGLGYLNGENIKRDLRGKNLACWCPLWLCDKCGAAAFTQAESKLLNKHCGCGGKYEHNKNCHAEILLKIANE
jgi:hypothetical protein